MTEQEIKRSLISHKGYFARSLTLFDQQIEIFGDNKNEMNLENLRYQLKQLQKRSKQVTEKAESLAESKNEEMSEYGNKEL